MSYKVIGIKQKDIFPSLIEKVVGSVLPDNVKPVEVTRPEGTTGLMISYQLSDIPYLDLYRQYVGSGTENYRSGMKTYMQELIAISKESGAVGDLRNLRQTLSYILENRLNLKDGKGASQFPFITGVHAYRTEGIYLPHSWKGTQDSTFDAYSYVGLVPELRYFSLTVDVHQPVTVIGNLSRESWVVDVTSQYGGYQESKKTVSFVAGSPEAFRAQLLGFLKFDKDIYFNPMTDSDYIEMLVEVDDAILELGG